MKSQICRRAMHLTASVLLVGSLAVNPSHADATIPDKDIDGAADSPLIKRYEGSHIVSYDKKVYGELALPLAALKASDNPDERDAHNNRVYRPDVAEDVAGTITRLAYVLPEDRSPLEVLRNYQDEIEASGGEVKFECKRDTCGGDQYRTSDGGGGKMSLTQNFFYASDIKEHPLSTGGCALTSRISDQHYLTGTLPAANGTAWVTVQTYQPDPNPACKALKGRTIALVHVIEPKAREKKMVVVKADEMAKTIDANGSISLYGIYFDTDKADLKAESEPTLQEIANLLAAEPKLVVLVVGHTDNQGKYDYNLDLSSRRAAAVKNALVSKHGVDAKRLMTAGAGMMAPIANNDTEEGRAKNRRVVLVKAN